MSKFMGVYEPVSEFIIISPGQPDRSDEYNVKRVMQNSKVQKYIVSQCTKLYTKYKKQYPSLIKELPSGLINAIKKRFNTFKDRSIVELFTDPSAGFFNVDKYTVCAFGNEISMTLVKVIFYIKDSDKYLVLDIPSPTSNDVRDAGYRSN